MNPNENRERMTQIMFEKFEVPAYVYCWSYGIPLDIGDGTYYTIPVLKGKPEHHAIDCIEYSGSQLTNYLMKILYKRGYNLTSVVEREIVRDIKEKLCYVALDYQQELDKVSSSGLEKQYTLPDKNVISVASERFHCPEALFQPHLIGKADDGIHHKVFESIMKCDIRSRRSLFGNIILAGGSTLFPGLAERMQKELSVLAPEDLTAKVIAPPTRGMAVWVGASTVAALPTFDMMWITKANYDEEGPKVINQKCV